MSGLEDNMTRAAAQMTPVDAVSKAKYPQLPAWYRKTTSFTAKEDVSLETLLQNLSVRGDADCLINKDSSLEGCVYSAASNVSFEINFFENAAAETVVEIARLSGCTIQFSKLFAAMQATFGKNVSARDAAADSAAPQLAGDDSAAVDAADTESVLSDALNIAKSPREETAAEGFALVASTVEDKRHQANVPAFLAAAPLAATLAATLKTALAEQAPAVRVQAAVAVAALAQHPAALDWVAAEGLVEAMMAQCHDADSRLSELQKRELYRQVARCVARAISASVGGSGKVTQEHVALLQDHFAQHGKCKRDEDVASDLHRSVSSLSPTN